MVSEPELVKLVAKATEASSKAESGDPAEEARAIDILKELARQSVTAELLQKTDAGKKVKKLSKSPSSKIVDAANACVECWKNSVRNAGVLKKQPSTASSSQPEPLSRASSQPSPSLDRASSGAAASTPLAAMKVCIKRCGDGTRDKVRELLAEALVLAVNSDSSIPLSDDPNDIAVKIELALFQQYGSTSGDYKAKARSLNFNLKDPKNPDLRYAVLAADVPAARLVSMTPEEMASDDAKKAMKDLKDASLKEAVRGLNQAASTDMFQCSRCKQRKCTYYQMQTRSADEPMTTFVTCINCQNRWKFC